jgi:hypothetical protein
MILELMSSYTPKRCTKAAVLKFVSSFPQPANEGKTFYKIFNMDVVIKLLGSLSLPVNNGRQAMSNVN